MTKSQFRKFRMFTLYFLIAIGLSFGGISFFMFIYAGTIIFLVFAIFFLGMILFILRELRSWYTDHPYCKAYYKLPD